MASGLSDDLSRHVASLRFDALPGSTIIATKRALLDGLGVMLAASGLSTESAPFLAVARGQGRGPAMLLGRRETAPPVAAAFANGALSHALDFEDAFDAAPCHPNAALLPAVLALAGARPISGAALVTAIAVGCDVTCRLALSFTRPAEEGGWYPPPIVGAYGATAAAASLLALDPDQVRDALSLTLCQAICPGEIKYSRDTVIRAVREAFPAQAAVQSVLLAEQGVRGFEQPLEGEAGFFRLFVDGHYDPAVLRDRLGKQFWIEELSFKRWPACRGTHPYIEMAQTLRTRGIGWRDVEEIVAVGGEVQRMLVEPLARKQAPATAIDAKFSIPFAIASAWIEDEVGLSSFAPDRLRSADHLALAARVRFEQRPDWGREKAAAGALRVVTRMGERYELAVNQALGHPDRPLSDDALRDKFVACAACAFEPVPADRAARLADSILDIDHCDDVGALLRTIVDDTHDEAGAR